MASSVVATAGRSLGSRHNSHSNLVRDDSVSDWLAASHDNTPIATTLPRDASFASLTDGFDIVSPTTLSWSQPADDKLARLNNADDYLSHLAEHSIDLKATLTETLHVDDFFNDTASASSSPYTGPTINLPGWNHGPEVMGGLIDSDVDSPEGIWYGQTQAITTRSARRGVNLPSFAISIDQADELDSPGGLGAGPDELLAASPTGSQGPGLLGAPSRTLRSCISAPLLQREDPVLEAAGSQTLINDYLIDVGFPHERIPGENALGLELGARATTASSPANDVPGHLDRAVADGNKETVPLTELAGNASVAQSSALFQRRAVQRDLAVPAPVAVPAVVEGDQTIEVAPGRTVTLNNPAESTLDPEKMTDEQRRRLAQLHQIHVAQQAARLGVYQDFVTPSQQFAGQEASERAAKAVQAALMYGMEGNSPRKLSMGSTGLLTPVTPQHPLQPGPGTAGAYQHGVQGYLPGHMQGYAGFDPRVPGMPLSADSASFAPSIQSQFSNLHLAQQQAGARQAQQGVFTPQFLHQNDATLFAGQAAMGSQDLAGYTSVYPPPRHNSISGPSGGDRSMHALTLNPSGMVGATSQFGATGTEQMLLPPRRGSHAVLRTTESSPSLASQIAANPMQLQNPFVQQGPATLEPAKLLGDAGMVPPPAATPRSAPADASREQFALQQRRMRQLQQQQLQLLQMQNQAYANNAAKAGPSSMTTRNVPSTLAAPLSPPRSPAKMKSTPHLRSPLAGTSGLLPSPAKPLAPGLRKIASNRRITTTGSASSSSASSSTSTSGGVLRSKGSILGGSGGFTLELTTSASPTRARTISHQSASSSRSHSSPGKSKSPTPGAGPAPSFSQLSFVNYGMNDADEICSAVAPSGSYKVPLRGFGASSGEEDEFDDDASSVRTRTMSNVTGITAMAASDDDDFDMTSPASNSGAPPSPTKRLRKNSSKPSMNIAGASASPLRSKRSMANIGSSRMTWDLNLNRSPRKAKSSILSPVSSAGSGE